MVCALFVSVKHKCLSVNIELSVIGLILNICAFHIQYTVVFASIWTITKNVVILLLYTAAMDLK